jgi:hypothetical protein
VRCIKNVERRACINQAASVVRLSEPRRLTQRRPVVETRCREICTYQELHDATVVAPGDIGQQPVFLGVSSSSSIRMIR